MYVINILYPKGDDTTFDMDYYTSTHMPMFHDAVGDNMTGWGVADSHDPNYHCFAWATFNDLDQYQAAMGEHGPAIMADVTNYTNTRPILITGQVTATSGE